MPQVVAGKNELAYKRGFPAPDGIRHVAPLPVKLASNSPVSVGYSMADRKICDHFPTAGDRGESKIQALGARPIHDHRTVETIPNDPKQS